MSLRHITLFSFLICLFLAVWAFLGFSSPIANAQFRAPSDAIPVTCTGSSIDDFTGVTLNCVNNGGINFSDDYQSVPTGWHIFVTDIAIVPTQIFTTSTPAMLRLERDSTGSTSNDIFYEMRITDSNSKSVSFQAPIIRLNQGDKILAKNLTSNSFTNDLRVYVTGWLTVSPTFAPTAVNGVQPGVQLAQSSNWQVTLLLLALAVVSGAKYLEVRRNQLRQL